MYKIGFILFLAIIFSSCSKDDACKQCTTTIRTSVNVSTPGYPQTSTTTSEFCGDDVKKVNGKTNTATSSAGSIVATSVSTTTCN